MSDEKMTCELCNESFPTDTMRCLTFDSWVTIGYCLCEDCREPIEKLQAEVNDLQAELNLERAEVASLRADKEILMAALEKYADSENWGGHEEAPALEDVWMLSSTGHEIANEALSRVVNA